VSPVGLTADLPGLEKLAPGDVRALQEAAWQAAGSGAR
jgi:hypothetical protein